MNKFYNTNRPPYAVGYRPTPPTGTRAVCELCERPAATACDGCGAAVGSKNGLEGKPLGAVYAPLQEFEGLYEPSKALARGTVFAALDLPFEGKTLKGGGCRG